MNLFNNIFWLSLFGITIGLATGSKRFTFVVISQKLPHQTALVFFNVILIICINTILPRMPVFYETPCIVLNFDLPAFHSHQ